MESEQKLLEYETKQVKGEKGMEPHIARERENKERLLKRKEELLRSIELENNLRLAQPEILGSAVVLPMTPKEGMVESEEIEKIGMQVAMEYERKESRIPEDLSSQNLGFDIRSSNEEELRYIEVKARAGEGKIALTPNEWLVANRFGEKYWLYIVANASSKPKLYIIQNPAKHLKPNEEVEVVRYIVEKEEWKSAAEVAA